MFNFNRISSRNISNEITYFISNQDQLTKTNQSTSIALLSKEDKKYLDQLLSNTTLPLSSTNIIQEHSLYKSLIQLKETEISNLKSILSLKGKPKSESNTQILINASIDSKSQDKDNIKLQIEQSRSNYNQRLNALRKDNDDLYAHLISQSLYFKSKSNIIRQSLIDVKDHQSALDSITIQHQKKSIALLDKLLNLKNILNECEKALNTKSSRQSRMGKFLNKINTNLTEQ